MIIYNNTHVGGGMKLRFRERSHKDKRKMPTMKKRLRTKFLASALASVLSVSTISCSSEVKKKKPKQEKTEKKIRKVRIWSGETYVVNNGKDEIHLSCLKSPGVWRPRDNKHIIHNIYKRLYRYRYRIYKILKRHHRFRAEIYFEIFKDGTITITKTDPPEVLSVIKVKKFKTYVRIGLCNELHPCKDHIDYVPPHYRRGVISLY